MGLVDRFERKLESTVGDDSPGFSADTCAPEFEAMLRREAKTGARELLGGRILAPTTTSLPSVCLTIKR